MNARERKAKILDYLSNGDAASFESRFVKTMCVEGPSESVGSTELYNALMAWSVVENVDKISTKLMARHMLALGFVKDRRGNPQDKRGRVVWRGLRLRSVGARVV